jgi:hypothetical protein
MSGQRAKIETEFVLDDPRVEDWSSSTFRYYFVLWCIACRERQNPIPAAWTREKSGLRARLDPKTTRKCHQYLLENSFIAETPDGRIIVYGVEGLNEALNWKTPPIQTPNKTQTIPVHSLVGLGRVVTVDATHLPADAGTAKAEPTQKPEKAKRSPAQKSQDQDLEDLKKAWVDRWPKATEPTYPILAEVIAGCKRVGCSPAWLVEQAPVCLDHPDRLLRMWLSGKTPMPERNNGHGSWHQWTERHKTRMKSLADVIGEMRT